MTHQSGSPFLVQVAGALLFVPLLAGGFLGGMLSHRADSWRVLHATLTALCLVGLAMCALTLAGDVPLWTLFGFILLVGIAQLVSMTVQREALFAVVGPRHASHSLVVDAVVTSCSMALGNLVAGALIETGGERAAFGGLLVLHLVGLVGYRRARPRDRGVAAPARATSAGEQWRTSLELLRRSPSLRLALAVTITMNSLVYGYLSLVPLLVGRFDSSALLASGLAAADGLGQVCGGLVLSTLGLRRPGLVLTVGAATTCTGILVLSQAETPVLSFVALLLAGLGTSGYAATQTVVALRGTTPGERSAVLGLVGTAIGVTPIGMLLIGVLAAVLPASVALAATTGTALVLVLAIAFSARRTVREP